MKRHICLVLAYLSITFGCHKDSGITNLPQPGITVQEARFFFEKEVLANSGSDSGAHVLQKQPDWEHAAIERLPAGEAVVVPLIFPRELYVKLNQGKISLATSEMTQLLFYRNARGKLQAEVVTAIPDDSYLTDSSGNEPFTGMIWVADWQGRQLRNFRYDRNGGVERFELLGDVNKETARFGQNQVRCYVDFYSCTYAGYYSDCRYEFTKMVSCGGSGAGLGGGDGFGADGYRGVGSGRRITENTPIVFSKHSDGTPIIVKEYMNCFADGKPAIAHSLTIYIQQPIINQRKIWRMNRGSVDAGHTFVMLKKINADGTEVKQVIGLYPKTSPSPARPEVDGLMVDNSGHEYNVSMELIVTESQFNQAISIFNGYQGRNYHLNNFNCTDVGIEIAKLSGINIPDPQGTWVPGSTGSNPGLFGYEVGNLSSTSNMKINKYSSYQKAPIGNGPCK